MFLSVATKYTGERNYIAEYIAIQHLRHEGFFVAIYSFEFCHFFYSNGTTVVCVFSTIAI